jgi:hypothetical protein
MSEESLSNTTQEMSQYDTIDKFLTDNMENILDIFYDIKDRFKFNPFFLQNLFPYHLTDIFVWKIFNDDEHVSNLINVPKKEMYLTQLFDDEYYNEITTSLRVMSYFLQTFKKDLSYEEWMLISYNLSNLSDVTDNSKLFPSSL